MLGFKIGRNGNEGVEMTYLLFADDTLIFCDACEEQIMYLGLYIVVVYGGLMAKN